MDKRIVAIVVLPVFMFVMACGVPQPTPSSGGGAEKAEDNVLSEDEIESEMNDELGDTDGDEEEVEEEEAAPTPGEAVIEVVEETEETPEE